MEMGNHLWPMTHVTITTHSWPMTHMTHDPWPLHHFILRMGLGGGVAWWYRTTLSVLIAKKSYIKIKPPAMIIGLIEWVSSFLMSTKNKKMQVTAQLFHHNGSMGHWQWPMTHVTHPKMVTHSTHDPRPTDPFPSLARWQETSDFGV